MNKSNQTKPSQSSGYQGEGGWGEGEVGKGGSTVWCWMETKLSVVGMLQCIHMKLR